MASRWVNLAAGAAAAVTTAVAAGNMSWNRTTERAIWRLRAGATAKRCEDIAFSLDELAGLPPPVARYFAFALPPGGRIIEDASLLQSGMMRTGERAAWRPFTATEVFSTRPVGFVWDASMAMLPLVSIRIRDEYVGGRGASEAKVGALLSVGKQAGTPEVASASLVRYLAEAPWLPTALLPRSGVVWTPLTGGGARATLTDGDTTVSLELEFGDNGEIVRTSALRYRAVGAENVLTHWTGRYGAYARVGGMMIPTEAEVAWGPPQGEFSVWRGRITGARYRYATEPVRCREA